MQSKMLIGSEKIWKALLEWFAGVNGVIRRRKQGSRTPRPRLARKSSPILEQYQELSEYEIHDSFRAEAFRTESLW